MTAIVILSAVGVAVLVVAIVALLAGRLASSMDPADRGTVAHRTRRRYRMPEATANGGGRRVTRPRV